MMRLYVVGDHKAVGFVTGQILRYRQNERIDGETESVNRFPKKTTSAIEINVDNAAVEA
jgi:hypothetical protein